MLLTRKSSAWFLTALQALFAGIFIKSLADISGSFQLFQGPSWFTSLVLLQAGVCLVLFFTAMWKHELTAIVLLITIHIVCPLLFFTDLTRNPYFTQIVLLNVWVCLIWIAWAWECWKTGRMMLPKTPLDLPLMAFLGIAALSWLLSFVSHESLFYPAMFAEGSRSLIFVIFNTISVFYIAVMVNEQWRGRFIWVTFWVGGIAAFYGLMQFFGIEQIWQKALTPFANRPVSTFGNPNFLSSYLVMLIPLLTVSYLVCRKVFTSQITFVLLITLLSGVLTTMTRSSWVGVLVALALLPLVPAMRQSMKKNWKKLSVFFILLILSIVFWPKSRLGGYSNPLERILEIKEVKAERGYGPWHQRLLIWSSAWSMVQDHIVIGKGWGLFELFYPYYQGKLLFSPVIGRYRTHANNAHNEVLEVWSQTGSVGMGIYVWLWVVLFVYGIKVAREFQQTNPEKSMWAWCLTASAGGMLTDNFFGNVSIHFAVPAFLFWWQVGLLFSLERAERQNYKNPAPCDWYLMPAETHASKTILCGIVVLMLTGSTWHFCREFQEIRYFRGFKISKSSNYLSSAKDELESAWRWYPREVNCNYELANTYARLSHESAQKGLQSQSQQFRAKSIWGYRESLRANCGYDEIFFNLGAVQSQLGWHEDNFPDMEVETPRGMQTTERSSDMHGSIFNYSRALAINPLSQDAYIFLGNVFLPNRDRYQKQALLLFERATRMFPKNKDFWVNLAFLQIQEKNYTEAYGSLKKAMMVDPFYMLTHRNVRALLTQMNRLNDPLAQVEQAALELNDLIKTKNWARLKERGELLVKILPENFQLHFILANTYFELHEYAKAEKEYLAARIIQPNDMMCLNNLALAYRSQDKTEEAKKVYKSMLELNPDDAQVKKQLESL